MKPLLDKMIERIVAGLSGKAKAFYDLEFNFFAEVTSIQASSSRTSKVQPEKKVNQAAARLCNVADPDRPRLMRRWQDRASVGVYLPSNPDGIVVDLDRKSGRPCNHMPRHRSWQRSRCRRRSSNCRPNASVEIADEASLVKTKYDVWQSAIFRSETTVGKTSLPCRSLRCSRTFLQAWTGPLPLSLPWSRHRPRCELICDCMESRDSQCGVIDVVPTQHRETRWAVPKSTTCLVLCGQVWRRRHYRFPEGSPQLHPVHGSLLGRMLHSPDQGPS